MFYQHARQLLKDLWTIQERSNRRYNMYRFVAERERMWRGMKRYNTGRSLDNNKVSDQHHLNTFRLTTARKSIEASLVTITNIFPRFTSFTPIQYVQRSNEQRTNGFRNCMGSDENTRDNRAQT